MSHTPRQLAEHFILFSGLFTDLKHDTARARVNYLEQMFETGQIPESPLGEVPEEIKSQICPMCNGAKRKVTRGEPAFKVCHLCGGEGTI